VDTVLIVGAESIIGANLATTLTKHQQVVAIGTTRIVEIAGCRGGQCDDRSANAIQHWIETVSPDRIVVCGIDKAAWDNPQNAPVERDTTAAVNWARAASGAGCPLTVFSSDGVFTGPWMFHDEHSGSLCTSLIAAQMRAAEQRVLSHCPAALVVRTHVIGWSPFATGWLDTIVEQLETGNAEPIDCIRHASPLPAHLLGGLLQQAWNKSLRGICHIAGSERISPQALACSLADQLDCSPPPVGPQTALSAPPIGFGLGETSLVARRLRDELKIAPPSLKSHLGDLITQRHDGWRDRLLSQRLDRVA